MSFLSLRKRIDKLMSIVDQAKNAIFELPTRHIRIDDDGKETIISETPYNPAFKGVAYKEYINIEEWEEGSS